VDCISIVETGETWTHEERVRRAGQYRRRYEARKERLELERAEQLAAGRDRAARGRKSATIERVIERASARLRGR
jgi:hypothetical protein